MQVKTIAVGALQTNCYLVADEQTKEVLVIDPGDEASKIFRALKALKVSSIVLTHGHPDHVGGALELKSLTSAKLLMHSKDSFLISPDIKIQEGDEIKIGSLIFKVLETPGHTPGSICLYGEGRLFSGDTLFAGGWGRTDLPGGSEVEIKRSLRRLSELPSDTLVYPGHDESTTIGKEFQK